MLTDQSDEEQACCSVSTVQREPVSICMLLAQVLLLSWSTNSYWNATWILTCMAWLPTEQQSNLLFAAPAGTPYEPSLICGMVNTVLYIGFCVTPCSVFGC